MNGKEPGPIRLFLSWVSMGAMLLFILMTKPVLDTDWQFKYIVPCLAVTFFFLMLALLS